MVNIAPRSLGGIADADTQNSVIDIHTFVRLDFGGALGTKGFTNKPCDSSGKINLTFDGLALDYFEYDVEIGAITESMDDPETISFIKFGNLSAQNGFLAKQWTKWANNPGLRGVPIRIYRAQFNPTTGTLLGGYKRFYGELGGGNFTDEATITVKVKDTPLVRESPSHLISPSCVNIYRGPDCQYAGAEPIGEVTCGFSRANCRARGNELNFNGFDLIPAPGSEQHWTAS